jgi:hypothetical protein
LRADIPKIMDYRAQLPGTGDPIIQGIDNQIHFDDVEPAIRKIEQMTDDDIRALVRGIYDPGTEADRAVQTLLMRRDNLRGVFEKRFPRMGPVQPGALHWPRSRWWAGLWPRWQWQPAMALHPAG